MLAWDRLRAEQRERKHSAAERILLEYHQGLLNYAEAKEALVDAWYTEEQAVRMLRRVAQLHPVLRYLKAFRSA